MKRILTLLVFLLAASPLWAQRDTKNLVYVDNQGVLRYTRNNAEAAFFGVNYTTPFAHAYRAHKALNADLEQAIRQDVYHLSRLGLDAFRVHVWDIEITDSLGNLIENEHLRLFDFLLAELKKRGIKTIITPIAFWGNGYPESDERLPGFSSVGKGRATTDEKAIRAQENYLPAFLKKHVNPYTKLSYLDDPDVIAVEINNEPSHSGPKEGVTNYVNRLAAAIRGTGWTKPLFYNISQSTFFAGAIAASTVQGFSFQWYPTGLVAGREVKGNYLPHIDQYAIPYDTIPQYRNKARMIYEFETADVLQPYLYPAVARSFKKAGFQWVTQFAYDPMLIANVNTEYQTHYLNLAYTPPKAISTLIASKVFHRLPRSKDYGTYPADSVFDAFRVSYAESLSEMNTGQEFYYTSSTSTKPVNAPLLEHVAGTGSSQVVAYAGSGAYFLDKLEDGVWRLEVMPDALRIRDPFERASPKKEVTRISWQSQPMSVWLADLGSDFAVNGLNRGNTLSSSAAGSKFNTSPGAYLLVRRGKAAAKWTAGSKLGEGTLGEFYAPPSARSDVAVFYEQPQEISAGKPFRVKFRITGIDSLAQVNLRVNRPPGAPGQGGGGGGRGGAGGAQTIAMQRLSPYDYVADVPAEWVTAGVLTYSANIRQGNDYYAFPGAVKGNATSWEYIAPAPWQTFVAGENTALEVYDASKDRSVLSYSSARRGAETRYLPGDDPGQLIFRMAAPDLASGDKVMGFQLFIGDKLAMRASELGTFDRIRVKARTTGTSGTRANIGFISRDGVSYSAPVTLDSEFSTIDIPIASLKQSGALLLPRPYPGFMPLWFSPAQPIAFNPLSIEKFQVTLGPGTAEADLVKPQSIEIQSAWLVKKKN